MILNLADVHMEKVINETESYFEMKNKCSLRKATKY